MAQPVQEFLRFNPSPGGVSCDDTSAGLGRVLNDAIRANDFSVIYGVVLFVTIAVATLMVLMEFLYPLLDPRIKNQ